MRGGRGGQVERRLRWVMGDGGHLSGSNVHCASPTHPNLCMSDVLSMTADRTNCLIHVKRKCLKFGFGAALIIPRKHVDAASKDSADASQVLREPFALSLY